MQAHLFMVEITHEVVSTGGDVDEPCVGYGTDGHLYSLKRLEDGPLIPATEWVCHSLSRAVGIPTPDFLPVKRQVNGDIAFATRIDPTNERIVSPHTAGAEPLEIQIVRYFTQSVVQHSQLYGLDAAIGNTTRGWRSFVFRRTPYGVVPLAQNFRRAWVAEETPFGEIPWQPLAGSAAMMRYLYSLDVFDAAEARATVDRLYALSNTAIQDALNTCHPSWVQNHNWQPTLDLWSRRQQHLKPLALQNFSAMP